MAARVPISWRGIGLAALLLGLGACSSSSSNPTLNSIASAVQDLSVDPDGRTTVLTFDSTVGGTLTVENFSADGGQSASSVSISGADVTVTWDARVTPSHQVRVDGHTSFSNEFVDVTTTDASAPTFAASGTQQVGAPDEIEVAFSGPRVVEALAEDVANWRLEISGEDVDLTGSTLDLDPASQVLTITLGSSAFLHASFDLFASDVASVSDVAVSTSSVTAAATGDSTAPSVVSAEQNLAADEFGRVVDFHFDEAMSEQFGLDTGRFFAGPPVFPMTVELADEDTIRVAFNAPMIPGDALVDLLEGLMDVHGNGLGEVDDVPVTAGSTVANAFASVELRTVPNSANDLVVVRFDQAIDPADADDPAHWSLTVDATPVVLADQELEYDLLAKTLTVTLEEDQQNGSAFTFGPAVGAEPRDVDAEPFVVVDFAGTVDGDVVGPAIVSVTQNRDVDLSGLSIDVLFDEQVDPAAAGAVYSITGSSVDTIDVQDDLLTVRLTLDELAMPGVATLSALGVFDFAGNAMTPVAGVEIGSTDADAPASLYVDVDAFEGPDNDRIEVVFSEDMFEDDLLDLSNWSFESPFGTVRDTSNATVDYDAGTHTATLVFDGGDGIDLQVLDDYRLVLAGARDLAGNDFGSDPLDGDVFAEVRYPFVESAWVETAALNVVHMRLSEPCQFLDDLFDAGTNPDGHTSYDLLDSGGIDKGDLVSLVVDSDGMGVTLTFSVGAVAGSDTLSVRGIADLAGNQMLPRSDIVIEGEETGAPDLALGFSSALTVEGEDNDELSIVFDRAMSRWEIDDPSHYDLDDGGGSLDLSGATFEFDGDRTVVVRLDSDGSEDLENLLAYTVTVSGLRSAQGDEIAGTAVDTVAPTGDSDTPALPDGRTRLDAQDDASSVLIEFSEAIDGTDGGTIASFDISGLNPDTVDRLGHRTSRGTWSGGVNTAMSVHAVVDDLAGNSGDVTRAISPVEISGPVVLSVAGVIEPSLGGDRIEITFDHPIDFASALTGAALTASQGGSELDLTGAAMRWSSTESMLTLYLPEGTELAAGVVLDVTVDGVFNHAGLPMDPPAVVSGPVSGDETAPAIAGAHANERVDATGATYDVHFDEDVASASVLDALQWSASGGQGVLGVQVVTPAVVRVQLSAPLLAGETLDVDGATDLAGNVAGPLSVEPDA